MLGAANLSPLKAHVLDADFEMFGAITENGMSFLLFLNTTESNH